MTNRIDIIGRLANEAEISTYTDAEGGTKYCMKWILAQYQGKEDTIFWYCSMYGDMDYLKKQMNRLHKGRRTLVGGTVFRKEKSLIGMNGSNIKVPYLYVLVRDVTYADGRMDDPDMTDETPFENEEMEKEESFTEQEDIAGTQAAEDAKTKVPEEVAVEQEDSDSDYAGSDETVTDNAGFENSQFREDEGGYA